MNIDTSQLEAAVARGEISPDAARAFVRTSILEATAAAAQAQAPSPATRSRFSPFALATRSLAREFPDTPLAEIQARIGDEGLGIFADRIRAEDALVLAADQAKNDAVKAASPEGRAAAAQALADERAATATQASNARLLLIEENGLDEASVASLTDAEALTYAGLTAAPPDWRDGADDWNKNVEAINRRAALDTGTDVI